MVLSFDLTLSAVINGYLTVQKYAADSDNNLDKTKFIVGAFIICFHNIFLSIYYINEETEFYLGK